MLKKTILSVIFVLVGCGPKQLTVYSCKSLEDAESCSSSCSKQNSTLTFAVNKNVASVLYIEREDGKQVDSVLFEKCTIFNDENWVCSESIGSANLIRKMTNGHFISGSELNFKPLLTQCAK